MKTKNDQNNQTLVQSAILEKLKDFGLTEQESRIYMFFNKNGPKKVVEIAKAEKIPRTRIYQILSTLEDRGIVEDQNDRPKKFYAYPIEKALESIINFENKKIEEIHLVKEDLAYLWYLAGDLKNKNLSEFDNRIKRHSNFFEFRNDFKNALKQSRGKPQTTKETE